VVELATPITLLLLLCVAYLTLIGYLKTTAQQVIQSDKVLAQANQIEKLLVDRETGLRGYLASGEPSFLEPYEHAQRALQPVFDDLARRVADQPEQAAQLADLRNRADRWQHYAQMAIAAHQRGDTTPIVVLYRDGKQQMDAMRTLIGAFVAAQDALRSQQTQAASRASDIVIAGGILLSIALGSSLVLFTRQQLSRLAQRYGQALASTEARAAELVAIRRKHELLLQSIDEGIFGLDRQGVLTFINSAAARMLGWTQEELLGQSMHDRMHHSYADGTPYPPEHCPIVATLRAGVVQQIAGEVFWRKDGVAVPVEYVSSPIVEEETVAGAVVVCRDISERRQLEAQLIQSQKLESIGGLAGGIAHDFNNLLTTIGGCADLARDTLPSDHPVQTDLQVIHDATERASALTRQLLSFARKQAIVTQTFNLNSLLGGIETLLQRTLGVDIELAIYPAPDLWLISADRNQIEQVLLNLAINARDAMPGNGKLIIETANIELDNTYSLQHPGMLPGPYVVLSVSDNGHGIPREIQQQIFEPFFTTKVSGQGSGLGLSTSYGIVKQHGGMIGMYSEIGQGTTFKVYLPSTSHESSSASEPTTTVFWGTETILLVEDHEPVRTLAAQLLHERGYTVLSAPTGEEGLRLAQAHAGPLDLLLADMVMPELSGMQLADQIAALRPGIKILFVSGYPERVLVNNGRLALERPVLNKPFTAAELLRAVRAALDR
jgi:PAS domain S-box-containing protein